MLCQYCGVFSLLAVTASYRQVIVRHDIRRRWYDDNGILNISVIDFLLDDTLV